ncbi:MAG: hypothetical protein ABJQ71_06110 [Roseibium sp.]
MFKSIQAMFKREGHESTLQQEEIRDVRDVVNEIERDQVAISTYSNLKDTIKNLEILLERIDSKEQKTTHDVLSVAYLSSFLSGMFHDVSEHARHLVSMVPETLLTALLNTRFVA